MKKNKKGISLIALVITIVIILILTSSVVVVMVKNNVIDDASDSDLLNRYSNYLEQLEIFKEDRYLEDSNFDSETLTINKNSIYYNTMKNAENINIKDIITNITNKDAEIMEVVKGELIINTKKKKEIKVAQRLNIEVNPYDIVDGELLSSDGNLLLMDSNGTLVIPHTINKIGEGAFANLTGLKKIIIPGNVKTISTNAFYNNPTLEEVVIEEGVERIDASAFESCKNLKRITIPDTVTSIGSGVFMYCYNLNYAKLPSNLEKINQYTFHCCYQLKNVELSKKLKEISSYSFAYCGLQNLKIPNTVINISETAFNGIDNIENITCEEPSNFTFQNGILMNKEKTKVLYMSSKLIESGDSFTIPDGIKDFKINISKYKNIKKIIIPSSVETIHATFLPTNIESIELLQGPGNPSNFIIENNTLYNKDKTKLIICYSKEKDIQIAEHIDTISAFAFNQAINLENVTILDCNYLESQVFSYNRYLKNIYLGKDVKNFHPIFKYHKNVNVEIDQNNPNFIVQDGAIYSKDKKRLIRVFGKITNGTFVIDPAVETISSLAFHNRYEITEIVIPKNVKNIENSFNFCRGLTKIEIPSNVQNISAANFSDCTNLKEIIVHKKKDSIKNAPWACPIGMRAVKWVE